MSHNYVQIEGRLTGDPELRFTKNGDPVLNGSVAVWRPQRQDISEEDRKNDHFFNFTVFGDVAKNMAESGIGKGTMVILSGELNHDTWTSTDSSGNEENRSTVKLFVREAGVSFKFQTVTGVASSKEKSSNTGKAKAKPSRPPEDEEDDSEAF